MITATTNSRIIITVEIKVNLLIIINAILKGSRDTVVINVVNV